MSTLLASLLCCLVPSESPDTAGGASMPRKQIHAYRLPEDRDRPVIDGRPDEAVWQTAGWHGDFIQVRPEEFAAPSQLTEIAVLYDDQHLYVAARLRDSEPRRLVARQWIQGRDFEMDDRFAVILDTFRNRRDGYLFQLNPNGIRNEALIENNRVSSDWQTIWHGAAQQDESGWSVEMAIPFASLNFRPGANEWGINFGRVIRRHNEEIAWSTRGADIWMMAPVVSGLLTGLQVPDKRRSVDLRTAAIFRYRRGNESGRNITSAWDLFYRPSSAFTLSATLNTDFSTVEADDRIVNLDRFDVLLPEKRDFFLQDSNIFEFEGLDDNGRPFVSRSIGLDRSGRPLNIVGGGKLTGRSGRWTYGLLGIRQETIEDSGPANLAVVRVQANVLDESRVGVIATRGAPDGDSAGLYGADFNYRNSSFLGNRVITAKGWYKESHQPHASGESRSWGWGWALPSDRFHVDFTRQIIEKDFHPGLGFVNRPDIDQSFLRGGYRFRFEGGSLRSFEPWLVFNNIRDLDDGRLTTRWLRIWPFALHWHSGDYLELWRDERVEVLDTGFSIGPGVDVPAGRHRFSSSALAYSTSPHRRLSGQLTLERGGFFDGKRRAVTAGMNWRPLEQLSLSADFESADIALASGQFVSRLIRLRGELAITPTLAWMTTAHYDNLSTVLGINSRIRWWPRAGQTLDIVFVRGVDQRRGVPGRIDDTAVTVKYSHNFRF